MGRSGRQRRCAPRAARLGQAFLLGLALLLATAGPPFAAEAAPAPHRCECVEYVKNVFGLRGAAGNARDMGAFLAAHGFRRSAAPVVGAVVVIQPAYYAAGSGALYGHAGIVEAVSSADHGARLLRVRSANQQGRPFSAAGCSNVTVKPFRQDTRARRLFSYWLPPALAGRR